MSILNNEHDVRHFAGWNHNGDKLAYVSPMKDGDSQASWALLFPPIPAARDRVYIANGQAADSAKLVQDDVRITFPQWSPTKDELSLWSTYTPTHRSWLSMYVPWSLRPGDPAAILDCASGDMSWMAVNSHEQSQVGHYYLLKADYEAAWKWYEQASIDRPSSGPITVADLSQIMQQLHFSQDPTFFEYYCLTKLGRTAEAEQRLQQFRDSYDEP